MSDVLDASVTIKQSAVADQSTLTCCEVNGWGSDGSDGAVMGNAWTDREPMGMFVQQLLLLQPQKRFFVRGDVA